jgi:hypothetical protein
LTAETDVADFWGDLSVVEKPGQQSDGDAGHGT